MKSFLKTEAVILAEAHQFLLLNDCQGALQVVFDEMKSYQVPKNGTTGFTAGMPQLDILCQSVGAQFLSGETRPNRRSSQPLDVYLVTEIYDTGGHTGLIGDYVVNSTGRKAVMLISNALNRDYPPAAAIARTGILPENIEKCPHDRLLEQTRWMIGRLEDLQADRLYILNHPNDPVPIAAAQPGLAQWIYYVHHADHTPALGVSLSYTRHLDLTPRALACCRSLLRVPNTVYLPLQCHEPVSKSHVCNDFVLTTATSGSSHKFSWKGPIAYPLFITALLAGTSGRHFHIGVLSDKLLEKCRMSLSESGISHDRFVYVPYVSSLWQSMHDLKIDLYLHSFPIPGARAAVEVMGSGTPILQYSPLENPLISQANLIYPEVEAWSTTEQLIQSVRGIDSTWLTAHRRYARNYYEQNHARERVLPAFQKDPISRPSPAHLSPELMELFSKQIGAYHQKYLTPAHLSFFQKMRQSIRNSFK